MVTNISKLLLTREDNIAGVISCKSTWCQLLRKTMRYYSWIGRPERTHTKSICRETERATTDLNIRMKSSQPGASFGGVQKIIFSFFGELFLKIDKMHGTVGCASSKALIRRSQVLLKCLSLTTN